MDGIYALNGAYLRIDVPDITLRSASGNRQDVILDSPSIPGHLYQIPANSSAPGISRSVRASLLVGGAATHLPIILG